MHEIETLKMMQQVEREIEERRTAWLVQLDLIEQQERRMAAPAGGPGMMARLWTWLAGRPETGESCPVQPELPRVEPRHIEADDLAGKNALLRFFQGGEGA